MTPNNWLGIIAFFFFIAPGLHYDRKAVRKKIRPRETTFAEISRVALVSTACSVPAFGLLGAVAAVCAWQDWKVLPDMSALLRRGNNYFADNVVRVSVTFVALAAASFLIADLAFRWIHRKKPGNITFESTWREVLRLQVPSGAVPHVRARMKDGSTWTGRVAFFSPDPELVDREIVLAPPIYRTPKPDADGNRRETKDFPELFERVIIKDAEIAFLAVKFEPEPEPDPLQPGWWDRQRKQLHEKVQHCCSQLQTWRRCKPLDAPSAMESPSRPATVESSPESAGN
ncbi:DUF6338 family protein [Nocardia africana]